MQEEFYLSCANGYTELVRKLLKDDRVNPAERNNHALYLCAKYGQAGVARVLLADSRVDPAALNNFAVRWAACEGWAGVVRVLLADPRVDPSTVNNEAARMSARRGFAEVLRLLLADDRVNALSAIEDADRECARLLAADERFGIVQHRALYVKHHFVLVRQYDRVIDQAYTMAWVAKQHRTWESLVEPVAKRLKAGFICE